jgi:hypothetical protein
VPARLVAEPCEVSEACERHEAGQRRPGALGPLSAPRPTESDETEGDGSERGNLGDEHFRGRRPDRAQVFAVRRDTGTHHRFVRDAGVARSKQPKSRGARREHDQSESQPIDESFAKNPLHA